MDSIINYYEVLEVERTASDKEIKASFRQLALSYHPDKNLKEDTNDRFAGILEAYEVTMNIERRLNHDADLETHDRESRQLRFRDKKPAAGSGMTLVVQRATDEEEVRENFCRRNVAKWKLKYVRKQARRTDSKARREMYYQKGRRNGNFATCGDEFDSWEYGHAIDSEDEEHSTELVTSQGEWVSEWYHDDEVAPQPNADRISKQLAFMRSRPGRNAVQPKPKMKRRAGKEEKEILIHEGKNPRKVSKANHKSGSGSVQANPRYYQPKQDPAPREELAEAVDARTYFSLIAQGEHLPLDVRKAWNQKCLANLMQKIEDDCGSYNYVDSY